MKGREVFATLLSYLWSAAASLPDERTGSNKQYSMLDILRSAFAVFFMQSPSFLSRQTLMQQAHGMNNGSTLFGITKLPSDNEIRILLDPAGPKLLRPVFEKTFAYLQDQKAIEKFRSFGGTLLIAMDGSGYYSSEAIHCESCSVAHHRDGRTVYTHSALMPAIVKPECPLVIALEPEFIVPQDGHDKQDCETQAAKRWLSSVAPRYSPLGITILADDLFATQPFIDELVAQELQYILVAKPASHKYLYEEIDSLEKLGSVSHLTQEHWNGKEHRTFSYRYLNEVPLRSSPDSISVNWAELVITSATDKVLFRTTLITSYRITKKNVVELVEAGRARWKIENEDFNTLKTKGYHFEHNFGHGKQHLASTLLSLNLLAFLFHTVLDLLDERYGEVRKRLPRRDTFYQHLAALTEYLCFASLESLLAFMLRALEGGPAPPPDPTQIIH